MFYQATIKDVPSFCRGIQRRALQWRRKTHVLSFGGGVGIQLLLLVDRSGLRKLTHGCRERWKHVKTCGIK